MQDSSTSPTTAESSTPATPTARLRGFAAMSPEKKKEIASLGGRAAHACGRAHQFSSEEARAAGKKRHQRKDGPAA
ncbi:MAG TPA: KGG domain-containing protein [Ramlibacter sp.]|jgi:general stress protein YciG